MIAGQRRQASNEVLTVDYADVLRQAVLNERARVLRNVRDRINKVATVERAMGSSYRDNDRHAVDFKKDVLREIGFEEESG